MKRKLDSDALSKLVANHVEKVVLALVLVIFGLLVYSGLSIEPYPTAKNPENLTDTANQVMGELQTDHWTSIQEEPDRIVEAKYEGAVDTSQSQVDPGLDFYAYSQPLKSGSSKRKDPEIDAPQFAPQQIEVASYVGAFSFAAPGANDPYAALEDAPAIAIEEEKKPKPKKKSGRAGRSDYMSEDSDTGADTALATDSYMDSATGGVGSARKLADIYNKGFPGALPDTIAVTQQFIVGSAVMPNELLDQEFQNALYDAKGFDPRRDRPQYLAFRVIRADVTDKPVDQLEAPDDDKISKGVGDWVETTSNSFMDRMYLKYWAGAPGELVPSEYVDPVLTTPLPPLLMQDYMDFAGHSLIPFLGQQKQSKEVDGPEDKGDDTEENVGPVGGVLDETVLGGGRRRQFGRTAGGSSEGYMNEESTTGADTDSVGTGDEMYGAELGSGYGSGSTVVVASEYKMIRFYDFRDSPKRNKFSPQPGRKYVYRIQVAVVDPNYPVDYRQSPALRYLEKDVLTRVNAQSASDAEISKQRGKTYRTGYRWTAWSEPSPPASLPELKWYAAGGVEPATYTSLEGKTFLKTAPKASVVAVNWESRRYATELTAAFEGVGLGTPLDKRGFTDEIVDPRTLEIKSLPDAEVTTGGVIVDIVGGEPLSAALDEETPLTAPGMILLFDENGGLQVRNEIDDAMKFRKYTFADEVERLQKSKAPVDSMELGEGYMEDFSFE